ncbi:hypothetical protein B0J14DRAFT_587492 [Halenospora varia]|nr:hypothetical protein B0J14DRAFT_587492 [Halenospora varia]
MYFLSLNMRNSFASGDEHLSLAPREVRQRLQEPPPSYDPNDSYRSRSSSPRLSISKTAPEYVMRDEERYPTPVEENPGLQPYIAPFTPTPRSPVSSEIVSPIITSPLNKTESSTTSYEVGVEAQKTQSTPARKYYGLPRRIFFALVAGSVLLAITAITIGVVVALKLKAASETTRLPGLTSSGLFLDTSNTIWNSQIAYTNTTTGKVNFRLNNGSDTYAAEQAMNLTLVPATNAPMSMVSMLGTNGNIYLNLFYIYNSQIVLANISCELTSCTTIYNGVISRDVTYPVYKSSGLAAIYLGSKGFRVFYHNTDLYVSQLSMQGDGNWDHATTISGKAVSGSSISATEIGTGGTFAVFYVEDKSKNLYYTQYNRTFQAATSVSSTSSTAHWSSLTAFSTCWQPSSDTAYVFFTGSNKLVYKLASANITQSSPGPLDWGSETHDLSWVPSDAMREAIGAIAWDHEARFYRLVEGQMAQSQLSAGVWSAKFI